jgi:ADP-ribose pyrophosphatase
MPKAELQVKASRVVFKGKVFSVTRDTVVEPGGVESTREVVRHAGSAVIMPRLDDGRILLVRQFRLPVRERMWELAAGRLDPGEKPLDAARRELREETGFSAAKWKLLGDFYPSPGYVDERMWLFVAQGLERGPKDPDEDESIRQRWFSPQAVENLIRGRKIKDGKTLIGLYLLQQLSK